jgi:hypothetical protein
MGAFHHHAGGALETDRIHAERSRAGRDGGDGVPTPPGGGAFRRPLLTTPVHRRQQCARQQTAPPEPSFVVNRPAAVVPITKQGHTGLAAGLEARGDRTGGKPR